MEPEVQKEIKKLKSLRQYQNAEDVVLEKQAEQNVVLRQLVSEGNFINEAEKKQAKLLFDNFLKTHSFESLSDLNTLSILIFNLVLLNRIQKSLNDCSTKDGAAYLPDKLLRSMHEVENQVEHLKVKLGIDRPNAEPDEMSALQLLKKRFSTWILENRAEHTLWVPYTCSACGKQDVEGHLLRLKVSDYEVLKHPFFSGRFLWNSEIMKDVEDKVITPEQAARYLHVSVDYISWALSQKGRILPTATKD